jgi:enhancing lycopene biosynthesis protein 2
MKTIKIALILSGCGQMDGSEIHETLMTLLALSEEKIDWCGFAPDTPQKLIFNHLKGEPEKNLQDHPRNILEESARLMRGKIAPLSELILELKKPDPSYQAIIIPGGYGAVIHLCNFKDQGFDFEFHPEVQAVLTQAKNLKMPVGFMCIAPVMIPKIYPGAIFTIGNDPELIKQINALGCTHRICTGTEIAIDQAHKIVSTPANMVGPSLAELYQGIHALVKAVRDLV